MLLFGGMWTLGFWIKKPVEFFKQGLMGHTSRSFEDNSDGGDLSCGGPDQDFSEEKSVGVWGRFW